MHQDGEQQETNNIHYTNNIDISVRRAADAEVPVIKLLNDSVLAIFPLVALNLDTQSSSSLLSLNPFSFSSPQWIYC